MLTISNMEERQVSFPADSKVLPGGEVHPSVNPDIASWKGVVLTAHLHNGTDIMELLTVTDAIRRLNPAIQVHLHMPYLPYARQDRVPRLGESLTSKVFCDLINGQRYDTVSVLDVHSDVGVALLDRVRHITLPQAVQRAMPRRNWANTVLVAPDAGALKKTYELAQAVGCPQVVCAGKHRDAESGKITGSYLNDFDPEWARKDWLVVDDIYDGGYTFIQLGKLMRERIHTDQFASKIELWVSHGLFTKGYEGIRGLFDRVHTTNSYHPSAFANTRPDGENDNYIYWHSVQGIMA